MIIYIKGIKKEEKYEDSNKLLYGVSEIEKLIFIYNKDIYKFNSIKKEHSFVTIQSMNVQLLFPNFLLDFNSALNQKTIKTKGKYYLI